MTSCRRFLRESLTCFRFRKGAEIHWVRVTAREGLLIEDVMHVTGKPVIGCFESRCRTTLNPFPRRICSLNLFVASTRGGNDSPKTTIMTVLPACISQLPRSPWAIRARQIADVLRQIGNSFTAEQLAAMQPSRKKTRGPSLQHPHSFCPGHRQNISKQVGLVREVRCSCGFTTCEKEANHRVLVIPHNRARVSQC